MKIHILACGGAVMHNIAIALQESGIVAPSTTVINGSLAIRSALFNHRTDVRDIEALIKATLAYGDALSAEAM